MARLAGLTRRERWGDWDRSPFTSESRSHVSVWEKPRLSTATWMPTRRASAGAAPKEEGGDAGWFAGSQFTSHCNHWQGFPGVS